MAMYFGATIDKVDVTEINVGITSDNIEEYFIVTNENYYFAGNGSVFTTNNGGINNSTAQTTLVAKQDIPNISFDYSYSSEANYDKFTLIVGGTTIENAVSGATTNKSYTGSLLRGQFIVFKYTKDYSANNNDDKCTFSNLNCTCLAATATGEKIENTSLKIGKLYIGLNDVARLVTKAYVGVDNVARLVYEYFDPTIVLQDFTYTDNGNGTYILTGWKGTTNGVTSTELIVPDDSRIIV